ncbi:MAG: hypothetical protein GY696_19260 [Gammaproteobacteria bacterium]|nr:hypothetical protein [Gammaproteobacteria bacterium]
MIDKFIGWITDRTTNVKCIHPITYEAYKLHNTEGIQWPRCPNSGAFAHCFLPINLTSDHWILAFIDMKAQSVVIYDSLASNDEAIQAELQHIQRFVKFATKKVIRSSSVDKSYQQTNGHDCGIFVCMAAYRLAFAKTAFCPQLFRRFVAAALVSKSERFQPFAGKVMSEFDYSSAPETSPSCVIELDGGLLSVSEKKLLDKGLTFIPTQGVYRRSELIRAVETFKRRMRLQTHFQSDNGFNSDIKFPEPSKFQPPKSKFKEVEVFLSAVESELKQEFKPSAGSSNMTTEDAQALRLLKKRANRDIVIKPADKGAGVAVLKRTTYESKCEEILDDRNVYSLLQSDPSAVYEDQISSFLQASQANGLIPEKTCSSLMTTGARPARFYGIPKVHKAGIPLRPIAGANGTATERISWYLHQILQPLVPRNVTAYIQDTNHFLQWLRSLKDIPKGALFVTMDVCSLYPNIPTDEGIEAVKNFLQKNSEHRGQKLHFLLQLLKFVLTCNNITHLDKHYLQVRGTAMGTRVAPTYANIYMHDLEQKVLSSSPYKPFAYKRYLDDIFMVWTHGEEALKEFVDFFNHYQAAGTIKLTYEYSHTSFTYLDVAGHILPSGTILTEVFKKSVARNSYLHYTSEHPKHLLNSIPYSQALRFKRICSNDASFERQSKDMARDFVSREYPAHVVQAAVIRARSEPIRPKDRPEGEGSRPKLHLSIPYGRQLPKISRILQRHYHILQQSETVKAIFPSVPQVVYSTAPSLRKHLVRAQLPTSEYQSHSKGSSRPSL